MTVGDLIPLLPFIIIGTAPVIIMLLIAFYRSHLYSFLLTLAGILFAFVTLFVVNSRPSRQITSLLVLDDYALFYVGLILASTLVVTVLSSGYLKGRRGNPEEFYILLLLAALGSSVLVASSHFASFFMGLEVLSISLYALVAYTRNEPGIEAGVKYLVLAAASSAFLLFGIALLYGETGTMAFSELRERLLFSGINRTVLLAGSGLIIVGAGFKLALVPFHMWTPDVYEGAPAPVTAFIATVSKGAMFALLLRYFTKMDIHEYGPLSSAFASIAVASMFIGNFLALLQSNVKRILAYSSIAHLGYLLVAFLSSGMLRVTAVTYYLVAYSVTTLGAFGVVTVLSGKERDADAMEDYQGLFGRRPWLAAAFSAMLFSLAGIPLTAGFIGKFYVLAAGADSSLWYLVIILVINSAMGLFYYLRIVVAVYARPPEKETTTAMPLSLSGSLIIAVLALALVWLGVFPGQLIEIIHSMTGTA